MLPRIGVSTIGADPTSWLTWCRRLEEIGVDEISVADHLKAGTLPPMVALAAAAAATQRVGLSTMVVNNQLRHPAVLANEALMVSELSSGRLTLGIGAGHAEDEHAAIGQPLPAPADRVDRLEEAVIALRRLLDGEVVTTTGPNLHLTELTAAPAPTHPVPLLVGGGSRAVLRIAARHADTIGLTGFSHVDGVSKLTHFSERALQQRLDLVREMPRDRPEPPRFQALVQLVRVTHDRQGAAEELRTEWGDALPLTEEEVLASPFLLLGTVEGIAAQLQERSARLGIETWTFFAGRPIDADLETVGSIVEALQA